MKITYTWTRAKGKNTICGDQIKVTITYSSFDPTEIDRVEQMLPIPKGSMAITECNMVNPNDNVH